MQVIGNDPEIKHANQEFGQNLCPVIHPAQENCLRKQKVTALTERANPLNRGGRQFGRMIDMENENDRFSCFFNLFQPLEQKRSQRRGRKNRVACVNAYPLNKRKLFYIMESEVEFPRRHSQRVPSAEDDLLDRTVSFEKRRNRPPVGRCGGREMPPKAEPAMGGTDPFGHHQDPAGVLPKEPAWKRFVRRGARPFAKGVRVKTRGGIVLPGVWPKLQKDRVVQVSFSETLGQFPRYSQRKRCRRVGVSGLGKRQKRFQLGRVGNERCLGHRLFHERKGRLSLKIVFY